MKIIKKMTKEIVGKQINIGEQIFNIYKNYIEFKRMTKS